MVATGETMAKTVGVRQLKNEATSIVRDVREHGAEYIVTVAGVPVAILRPCAPEAGKRSPREEVDRWLADSEELSRRITAAWPEGISAAEAVADQRQ